MESEEANLTTHKKVSADKMMVAAKGPVWHKKQKQQNIVPKGLTGLDKDATWGNSRAKGWVYGHGTFMLTSYRIPIVGMFQWMPNSGHEAKRMHKEIVKYAGLLKKVFMDSKADDQKIYYDLKENHGMRLVTAMRIRNGQVAVSEADVQSDEHQTEQEGLPEAVNDRRTHARAHERYL